MDHKITPAISNANSSGSTLHELQHMPLTEDFSAAAGPLRFPLTNDALFHIVFETNPYALKGLVSSLLHLGTEEITSVEVTNPLEFGSSIYSKSFVLDLRLLLNDRTIIDLEMQVESLSFWKERSLGYLCRSFDNLNKGESYLNTRPAIHIGILDFDLSPTEPEFYATYHLSNDITHQKYSDNFRLSVLQLRHTELATEEDCFWQLDLWAKFFKTDTWEEIHMLAEKNPYIADAARTIYRVSEDERVRLMCEAREEGEKTQRTIELIHQMELAQANEELRQVNDALEHSKDELKQSQDKLEQSKNKLEQSENELERSKNELERSKNELEQSKNELEQSKNELEQSKNELKQAHSELQQKDIQLAAALARIAELEASAR